MRLQLMANKNVYFGFAGAKVKFFNFSATSRYGFGLGIGSGPRPATGAAPAPDVAPVDAPCTVSVLSGVVRQLRSLLKIHTRRMQCRVEVEKQEIEGEREAGIAVALHSSARQPVAELIRCHAPCCVKKSSTVHSGCNAIVIAVIKD